jgi:hypothetical protein
MNANMKTWLEVGAFGLGAIILVGLLTKGNMGGASGAPLGAALGAEPTAPNYLTYNANAPDSTPISSISGSSPSATGGGGPTCACGGSSSVYFSGDSAFEQSLNQNLGDLVGQYNKNVLDAFPSFVTQFFNDTQGAEASLAAKTGFANLGNSFQGG